MRTVSEYNFQNPQHIDAFLECGICLNERKDEDLPKKWIYHDDKLHPMHLDCAIKWFQVQMDSRVNLSCPSCKVTLDPDSLPLQGRIRKGDIEAQTSMRQLLIEANNRSERDTGFWLDTCYTVLTPMFIGILGGEIGSFAVSASFKEHWQRNLEDTLRSTLGFGFLPGVFLGSVTGCVMGFRETGNYNRINRERANELACYWSIAFFSGIIGGGITNMINLSLRELS